MPVTIRHVVQSTIALLTIGLLTLLAIVGMTIWLNQRAEVYFDAEIAARTTRTSSKSSCAAHCRPPSRASAAIC